MKAVHWRVGWCLVTCWIVQVIVTELSPSDPPGLFSQILLFDGVTQTNSCAQICAHSQLHANMSLEWELLNVRNDQNKPWCVNHATETKYNMYKCVNGTKVLKLIHQMLSIQFNSFFYTMPNQNKQSPEGALYFIVKTLQ